MKRIFAVIVILLLASLACTSPVNINISVPTTAPNVPVNPMDPNNPVVPTAVIAPTEAPAIPTVAPQGLPYGFATAQGSSLTIFDKNGYTVTSVNLPGAEYLDSERLHIASGMNQLPNLTVLYQTWSPDSTIQLYSNGQTNTLMNVPDFASMLGVPGQPFFAFSSVHYTDASIYSEILAGDLGTIIYSPHMWSTPDQASMGIIPLGFNVQGGVAQGLWYTLRPWGIGGDIVFDPTSSLFYYNFSGGVTQLRGESYHTPNLSPDHTWFSYAYNDGMIGPMSFENLNSGAQYSFPLLADSDRGAGYGEISPGNVYIAWMEGHGWTMAEVPDFRATVRIADLNGQILANLPTSAFNAAAGYTVSWVRPVGWLDDQTLLVQVRGEDWQNAAILKVVGAQTITWLASGSWAGFTYP